MKIVLTLLLLVSLQLPSVAAEYIRATMTVTSAPSRFGIAFTVNGSTRIGSNTLTSSGWVTNLTAQGTATNIYNQSGVASFGSGIIVTVSGSNVVFEGVALTASVTTNIGTLVLTTNTIGNQYSLPVPFDGISTTNRTNNANHLVYGMNQYAVSNFAQGARLLTNFVNVGSSQTFSNKALNFSSSTNQFLQRPDITNAAGIGGTATFLTNGTFLRPFLTNATADLRNGSASNLTVSVSLLTNSTFHGFGSYLSNTVLHTVTVTNLSSPGSGSDSLQIGNLADASADDSISLGDSSIASGLGSIAIGESAQSLGISGLALGNSAAATGYGDLAFGNGAVAQAGGSIAIGFGSTASATNTIVIGYNGSVLHEGSIVIGTAATSTTSNQITLGTSAYTVNVPGRLILDQCLTNTVQAGTNRLYAVGLVRTNNSGFANGDNASVALGPYSYFKISGPTANYGIVGLAQGYDGRLAILQKNDAYTVTLKNDSGVEPVAANRIYTGTGADVTLTNNPGVIQLIYDGGSSRWVLISKSN